jgi:hypothetical protein
MSARDLTASELARATGGLSWSKISAAGDDASERTTDWFGMGSPSRGSVTGLGLSFATWGLAPALGSMIGWGWGAGKEAVGELVHPK